MTGRREWCGSFIGTSFRSRKWLTLDPCGMLCVLLSLSVHVFALVVISLKLLSNSLVNKVLFASLYCPASALALSSLYMAWATDPGAVPMGARPLTTFRRSASNISSGVEATSTVSKSSTRATRRCHRCNDNYKPPRAHHDSVTGRCIVKFDHFCPWVGNAIGAMNHKFFVLFIFYTLWTSLLSLVLIVIRLVHCGHVQGDSSDEWDEKRDSGDPDQDPDARGLKTVFVFQECEGLWDSNLVLMLLVCSIVFMVFTCVMMVEQLDAIEQNTSKIARMKMSVGQGGTELTRVTHDFNEMFGGDSPDVSWHWFLPLSVKFPRGMDKIVLGYEWDESFDPVPFVEPGDLEGGDPGDGGLLAEVSRSEDSNDSREGLVLKRELSATSLSGSDGEYAVSGVAKGIRKRDGTTPTFVGRPANQLT